MEKSDNISVETPNKELRYQALPIITQWRYQTIDIVPVRPLQHGVIFYNDHWVIEEPGSMTLEKIFEKYFQIFKKFQNFPFTFTV